MIFNVSTGGAALNYTIRASATVPSGAGKANEIAIVTPTAIGDVQINCTTAPTLRSDGTALQAGDVYIDVNSNSDIAFNVLKKSAVYCLPNLAYQYNGSAWVEKSAYVFQSGTWVALFPQSGLPLNSYTWDQINRIGEAGRAASYFSVGQEKTITLSTGEVITLQIIGMAHDNLAAAGGGKAPITFLFKNCMNAKQYYNASLTNAGGYSGCSLYGAINGWMYNQLPADLRAVMKTVNKLTSAGNTSSSIVTTQDKLFLLSEVEVHGGVTFSKPGEGTQYAYFTNGGTRVKTVNGAVSEWWTRSPRAIVNNEACYVNTGAGASAYYTNTAYGVALALCV